MKGVIRHGPRRLLPRSLPYWLSLIALLALSPWPAARAVEAIDGQARIVTRTDIPDPFPAPAELDDAVDFWSKVFGVWRRDQVAVHDDTHLGLVYVVLDLPGEVGESQTPAQKAFVSEHVEALKRQLRGLEVKLRKGQALSDAETALKNRITYGAGSGAVFGVSERLRTQRGMRERFLRGLEISGRYDAMFRDIFREAGLPPDLAYLPHVESSFVANARSSVGAAGIWQFMPSAARVFMQLNSAVDERHDPVAAARGAARYLNNSYNRLGDWGLAITSYNHGVGGMERARAQFGPDIGRIVKDYKGQLFGFASRNFYAEFLAVRNIITHVDKYFPGGVRYEPSLAHDRIHLDRPRSAARIAATYGTSVATLVAINPAWTPAAARGAVALPANVEVWLPAGTLAKYPHGTATLAALPADTAPAGGAADGAGGRRHTVRANETLSSIAQQYRMKVATLRKLNNIPANRDTIRIGQKLAVSGGTVQATSRVHVVRKGESVARIANTYGIKVATLLAVNEIGKKSLIHPGQRLRIPEKYVD
jgi:membrane-bound lytic murein transglycosylase D